MSERRGTSGRDGLTAILIAGPTTSGKSALALRVAGAIGGVVINADSMQVYRDLRIITARPSEADEALVPHALYGTVDGATNYSVARWLDDAGGALRRAREASLTPILVGGTGLYFKALTQGLSDIPQVPDAVRASLRAWAASRSAEALHGELERRDPVSSRKLRPTDQQRVLRALEVHVATGESLTSYQSRRSPPLLDAGCYVGITLAIERATLRERVNRRFETMVRGGALAEVQRLHERAIDPASPIMRAHGVPPLILYLEGRIDLTTAIGAGQADTRHYIKRQHTFFRHQLPCFTPVAPSKAEDAIARLRSQL